jgi:diguanylate cyclase (GGDEF)-like protein
LGGLGFAAVTYGAGTWLYMLEYRLLPTEMTVEPWQALAQAFLGHPLTLFPWLVGTSALFFFIGFLFERQLELASRYRTQSITDGLTGVHNRRYFMSQLPLEIARNQRLSSHLSVLIVDVDRFKEYNDGNGHLAGDEALRCVATVLRGGVRTTDLVARYGGEEFAIAAAGASKAAGQVLAERLRRLVEESCPVTVSVGVATYPEDGANMEELLRAADRAMYCAKGRGRNCVQVAGGAGS